MSIVARPREIARGVVQIPSSPLSPNVHVIGDVVVDAGTRRGARTVLRALRGRRLRTLVLTHVHPPTQGGAHALCTELGLELWCGAGDVATAETGETARAQPRHWFNPLQQRLFAGPGHPVARALSEGDEVAGFQVLEVPGHSPGHLALWREHDRTLLMGDVLNHQNVWTGRTGLHAPPRLFTPDPQRNLRSARRLAALRPATAVFSHGPPLRDPDRLQRFVAAL